MHRSLVPLDCQGSSAAAWTCRTSFTLVWTQLAQENGEYGRSETLKTRPGWLWRDLLRGLASQLRKEKKLFLTEKMLMSWCQSVVWPLMVPLLSRCTFFIISNLYSTAYLQFLYFSHKPLVRSLFLKCHFWHELVHHLSSRCWCWWKQSLCATFILEIVSENMSSKALSFEMQFYLVSNSTRFIDPSLSSTARVHLNSHRSGWCPDRQCLLGTVLPWTWNPARWDGASHENIGRRRRFFEHIL